MRYLAIFAALLIFASTSSADTISDINLWIGDDGITWIEERITVSDSEAAYSSILVPDFISNVTVLGPEGRLNYTLMPEGKYNRVLFYLKRPLEEGETKDVWVKFGSPLLTAKTGGNWVVSYYTPTTSGATIMRINFPVGTKIISLKPDDILRSYDKYALWLYPHREEIEFKVTYEYGNIPAPTTTTTIIMEAPVNDSRQIDAGIIMIEYRTFLMIVGVLFSLITLLVVFIVWKKRLSLVVREENNIGRRVDYEPDELIGGSTLVNGSISYSINGDEKRGSGKVKDSVIKMLDEKELAIVKILEKAEEEVTQAYIYKTTGIPKTSLSDIIRRIEKRNIVEIKKEGRTNWISLKEWVLE
ncbi:MAG: hypothetical protein ABIH11_07200 [Candidatus Altiarchaeota archaeon]